MGMCVISWPGNPERVHERIPAMWVFLDRWLHVGDAIAEEHVCSCTPGAPLDHVPPQDVPELVAFMKDHVGDLSDELNEWDRTATDREKWLRTIELLERCPAGFDYV
jgi:hypothetical protein